MSQPSDRSEFEREDCSAHGHSNAEGSHDDSFISLVGAAQRGHQDARGKLLASVRVYLLAIAGSEMELPLRAKSGCSDAVQRTLVKIDQHLGQFDGEHSAQWLAWAKKILANEIAQSRRRHYSEKRDLRREAVPGGSIGPIATDASRYQPERQTADHDEIAKVRDCLDELSPDDQIVIRLRQFEQLSFRDIADRMNRSETAVTKLWFRALVRLERVYERRSIAK